MIAVQNYGSFAEKIKKLRYSSKLFLFILYDDRPSHRVIHEYVTTNFDWFDSLAATSGIFGFSFGGPKSEHASYSQNPCLQVASQFGISANQLPGVVFFTDVVNSRESFYLPLQSSAFGDRTELVESLFADVFTACQQAVETGSRNDDLLRSLREMIVKFQEMRKPIREYTGAVTASGFPDISTLDVPESMSTYRVDQLDREDLLERARLYRQILGQFNLDEIQQLCFEIGFDYETIPGDEKSGKVRGLILFCQRRSMLSDLLKLCEISRPRSDWNFKVL